MLGDTRRDLRLLPAVVGAWVAAWVAPLLAGQVVVGTCSVCLGIAVAARRKPTVVGALVVTAAMLALMGVRVFTLEHGPVFELAQQHRSVIATGVLTSDPAFVDQPGFAGVTTQVRVDVRLDQVTAGATSWQIRSPVFVMGDADGWRDLSFGSRVELRGTLAPNQGVSPMAAVLFTRGPPQTISPPGPLLRGAEQMRSGLRRAMTGTTDDAQGLLPGLVVGDTSALSPELKDDLRASGLTHLTAVSGANVAIVLVVVIAVARLVGFRGYAVPAVGLVAVGWFVVLARPQPSVLRAAVMGGLGVVAVVSAGRRRNPTLLLAALLLLLLLDPWLSRSWGFALSAAATAGLVLVAGRWRDRLARRWPEPVADGVAVALAAQVATLPLVVALVWIDPAPVGAGEPIGGTGSRSGNRPGSRGGRSFAGGPVVSEGSGLARSMASDLDRRGRTPHGVCSVGDAALADRLARRIASRRAPWRRVAADALADTSAMVVATNPVDRVAHRRGRRSRARSRSGAMAATGLVDGGVRRGPRRRVGRRDDAGTRHGRGRRPRTGADGSLPVATGSTADRSAGADPLSSRSRWRHHRRDGRTFGGRRHGQPAGRPARASRRRSRGCCWDFRW